MHENVLSARDAAPATGAPRESEVSEASSQRKRLPAVSLLLACLLGYVVAGYLGAGFFALTPAFDSEVTFVIVR